MLSPFRRMWEESFGDGMGWEEVVVSLWDLVL